MNGTDITGYLYGDNVYCGPCIHDLFLPFELVEGNSRTTEDVLDFVATSRGINRHDTDSYTSYEFPHPLLVGDTSEADYCVLCGRRLLDNVERY